MTEARAGKCAQRLFELVKEKSKALAGYASMEE